MKLNKFRLIFSFILIFSLILLSTASAEDSSDLTLDPVDVIEIDDFNDINSVGDIDEIKDTNEINDNSLDLDEDSSDLADEDTNLNDKKTTNLKENDTASTPKTWTIYADKSNPNQVLNPTVQPIIDQANPGDTIILSGMFMHCHFLIEKPLTIIAMPGTSLGPCPHHNWPSYTDTFGVFYITEGGSGSVISGFEFLNNNYSISYHEYNPFAVYINGASDVELYNLTINWTGTNVSGSDYDVEDFIYDPIWIKNANNVTIRDSIINHTVNGITITNSSNVNIRNSTISKANNAAILIDDKSSDISISGNNITESLSGINMSYADRISIENNIIKSNQLSGVYLNGNLTQLNIIGNYFVSNGKHAIHYDYRLRNLNNDTGDDEKAIIDENVFSGQSDMIVHHTIYVEDKNGDYAYDEATDTYSYVGLGNGNYSQDKGYNYLRYALVLDGLVCGHSFITTNVPWDTNAPANNGAFNRSLSAKFVETQNGVYNFSIVDSKGNSASKLNSFDVLFYINDYDEESLNDSSYKVVSLENGSASVDFSESYDDIESVSAVMLGIDDHVFNLERGPRTWYVEPNPENPNQVQAPTVQPIIDKAKAGDTIVLNGTFVHCHFIVNKTLTIIASPGTSVGVCPHHTHMMRYGTGPETNGVFYISPEAAGTVISGFSFTNDFYSIANNVYNPFGVFVEADDVTLENLTFNWTGKAVSGNDFDPQDFTFNPVVAKDLNNLNINGLFINNALNAINITNSSNVSIENSTIANSKSQVLTGENTSNISLKDNVFLTGSLKAKSIIEYSNMNTVSVDTVADGRIGKYFTIRLVDENGNPLADKFVQFGFNGVVYNRTTDENGSAKLQINLKNQGTYTFAVAFLGDDDYNGSFIVAKIVVTKQTPKLTTSSKTFKASAKTKTLTATLKTAKGNALSGKTIKFTVNGKTYTAKTNKNGVASVKISLSQKKTYSFTVKFAGDNAYSAKSTSAKVIIK